MTWQYLIKAIVATALAVLGALLVVVVGDMTLGDLTTAQVIALIVVGVSELSAILALQAAPKTVATGIKE